MNNKTIVIVVSLLAIAVFAGGAIYQKAKTANQETPVPTVTANIAEPETPQTNADNSETPENNPLIRPHSPVIGPANAPVTIVEFLDPSCESCKAFFPTVEGILEKNPNDVRLVIRYAPFHQGSKEAVGILEAARRQDLFLPVLSILFERQSEWAIHGAPDLNKAWEFAAQTGMDLEQGKKDAADPAIHTLLQQEMDDIGYVGVRGTPSFFINGTSLAQFGHQQLIDEVDKQIKMKKTQE